MTPFLYYILSELNEIVNNKYIYFNQTKTIFISVTYLKYSPVSLFKLFTSTLNSLLTTLLGKVFKNREKFEYNLWNKYFVVNTKPVGVIKESTKHFFHLHEVLTCLPAEAKHQHP